MRFSEFLLNEAQGLQYRQIDNPIDIIRKKCSDALWMIRDNKPIYRGDGEYLASDFYTVDPSKTVRKSVNTTNHYTAILDHFADEWGFPKRSKSLICSTQHSKANGYAAGEALRILPYNDTLIGFTELNDIWMAESTIYGKAYSFPHWNEMFENDGIEDNWESFEKFQEQLNSGDTEALNRFESLFIYKGTLDKHDPAKFLEEIKKAYSPRETGFEVHTTKNMPHDSECEVWVGGPCLAVTERAWMKLVEDYDNLYEI